MKGYNLHDIVMFQSSIVPNDVFIGVIVGVGDEHSYRVRFYSSKEKRFGNSMAIVGSEVELIGPMPEGTEMNWNG